MKRIAHIITFFTVAILSLSAQKQLTNLPTLYIDTADGMPITSKEFYTDCKVTRVDASGTTVYDDGTIRGRGNSTWGLEKKPYRLKFKEKKKFLGSDRANAKSWVLLANHSDKTLLRNAVASEIGTICGQVFTAGAEFVDVVLNGEYIGNYQITDQIDIRKKRVNINEMDSVVPKNANYTGGYLVECDGLAYGEPVHFSSPRGVPIAVKSPDEDVIQKYQVNYISNHFAKFEDALFSDNFTDAKNGYRQYVDSLSLVSWYIATELTGNPDCFWSTYMYKERDDDHIFFGPMWDYDIAFNNCYRQGDIGDKLMIETAYNYYNYTGMWVNQMFNDPWFRNLLKREWTRIVNAGIEESIINYINTKSKELDQSQRLNFAIYPIDMKVYDELVLFSSYMEGVEYLKDAFRKRFPLLNQAFCGDSEITPPNPPGPVEPTGDFPDLTYPEPGNFYSIHNAKTGKPVGFDSDYYNLIQTSLDSIAPRPEETAFQWQLIPVGNTDTYRIINRKNGMAVTHFDFNKEIGLTDTLELDSSDQHWRILPVPDAEYPFVIIECSEYPYAWNNNGGFETDGNTIISWTSDNNNHAKPTRQWAFSLIESIEKPGKGEENNGEQNGLDTPHCDYAVTYSPSESAIHFIIYGDEEMRGTMEVFSLSGQRLMSRSVAPTISVADLQPGTYMVRWSLNGQQPRTTKFIR